MDVQAKVLTAGDAGDWGEVLKWEGRIDQLMDDLSDEDCLAVLLKFALAHKMRPHSPSIANLEEPLLERRVELLGKMQRFRDQGEAMCCLAATLLTRLGKGDDAERWYQRARAVGAAHGFFSVESEACMGLGVIANLQGRNKEGLDLMRNALVALTLSEDEDTNLDELTVLHLLIDGLFKAAAIDEVEPLVLRFEELAIAEVQRLGIMNPHMLSPFYHSARLHEVPCIFTPSWEPLHAALPLHSTETKGDFFVGAEDPRIDDLGFSSYGSIFQ